jgi:Protein of unknown function (DUF3891)
MNIRRLGSTLQLITQPGHAALAARIMRQWHPSLFPDSPRKRSILNAVEHHDIGWAEVDAMLVVDEATQQLLDFTELPDELKRETSWRGIDRLRDDPYAAALVSQHRLHVYRQRTDELDWIGFFAGVTAARDAYLRARVLGRSSSSYATTPSCARVTSPPWHSATIGRTRRTMVAATPCALMQRPSRSSPTRSMAAPLRSASRGVNYHINGSSRPRKRGRFSRPPPW